MEKRKKKGLHKGRVLFCLLGVFLAGIVSVMVIKDAFSILKMVYIQTKTEWLDPDVYPQELIDLLENNEETRAFVLGYPENKDKEFDINLSKEAKSDGIPLFMQWDKRWGYEQYGSNMIALTGCGPTCLSMVYIGLTGDASMNPKEMAVFSEENGYYTENGTSWSFMTEGAEKLGLTAEELPLDENCIKQRLLEKNPIICSMGTGDFTTKGHFIVLTGVDKNGNILLNDPNSKKNSEEAWDYMRLERQIKNLWAYTA